MDEPGQHPGAMRAFRRSVPRNPILILLGAAIGVIAGCHSPEAMPPDRDSTEAAIRANRMGMIVIDTAPGALVKVEQLRHEFWFGAALANQAFDGRMNPADAVRYKQVFLENFNSAVTENALKWLTMERQRGVVDYAAVDSILKWTDENGVPLRGHNVFWGVEKFVQPWLMEMDDDTLRSTVEARARDIGRRYKGRFAEYDLNNEMIHGNYYASRLGEGITLQMAQWMKEEDPRAILYLNDYDILTGRRLDDYVAHIRGLLAEGVPIAGIGVQGHLHAESFDPAALKHALDVLAQFGLPIRVTEFNLPGQRSRFHDDRSLILTPEEEAAKARDIVEYYRICFAHPSVSGILMWGFWEGANWIPASSLFRRDWSPTPAAEAYRDLIFKEWWTRWEGTADENGRCEVPAFFGIHRIVTGDRELVVALPKAAGVTNVTVR